jgi:hypothetical protein
MSLTVAKSHQEIQRHSHKRNEEVTNGVTLFVHRLVLLHGEKQKELSDRHTDRSYP